LARGRRFAEDPIAPFEGFYFGFVDPFQFIATRAGLNGQFAFGQLGPKMLGCGAKEDLLEGILV